MELKELMQLLVNTDDKMERMTLVEENAALLDVAAPEADTTEIDALRESNATTAAALAALQQKYIDTFFGGTKEESEEEPKDEPETIDKYLEEVTK